MKKSIKCEEKDMKVYITKDIRYIKDGNSKTIAGSRVIKKDCSNRTNCDKFKECKYLK